MAPAQPRCFARPSPPADMLKDVIREYDEHFPEIIERATYTLEKVGAGPGAAPWSRSRREPLPPASPRGPRAGLRALEGSPPWPLHLGASSACLLPSFLPFVLSECLGWSPEVDPIVSASVSAPTGHFLCGLSSSSSPRAWGSPPRKSSNGELSDCLQDTQHGCLISHSVFSLM